MRLMDAVKTSKIDVASIHDVDCTCFEKKSVEDVDIVNFSICYVDNHRDIASKIQEGMGFDGGLVSTKFCPRKD
jgi:hypothetical protein